jgi:hypothetical protein
MKKLVIAALVLANLGLLAWLMIGPATSEAQADQSYYRETNYIMVTGRVESGLEVLYVVDMASQKVAALKYDLNSQRLEGVGIRDLDTDFRGRD